MSKYKGPAVVIVGLIWALAFFSGIVTQDYTALGITTPVVMIAAGGVFAFRNGNNNSNYRRDRDRP